MTTPLNKNYWAKTESLSAETDTSHLNKTKHRDRDFTCGAETVRIGYSAEMTCIRTKHAVALRLENLHMGITEKIHKKKLKQIRTKISSSAVRN